MSLNVVRRFLPFLAVLALCLLYLVASTRWTPGASAQTEYAIILALATNTDCSVSRYHVDVPEGVETEKLIIRGVRGRESGSCSLIVEGSFSGLGRDIRFNGVRSFSGSLAVQKVELEHSRDELKIQSQYSGSQPPFDEYPLRLEYIFSILP